MLCHDTVVFGLLRWLSKWLLSLTHDCRAISQIWHTIDKPSSSVSVILCDILKSYVRLKNKWGAFSGFHSYNTYLFVVLGSLNLITHIGVFETHFPKSNLSWGRRFLGFLHYVPDLQSDEITKLSLNVFKSLMKSLVSKLPVCKCFSWLLSWSFSFCCYLVRAPLKKRSLISMGVTWIYKG